MSLDDSNTPAPASVDTGTGPRRGRLVGNVPLLIGLALLLLIGAATAFVLGRGDDKTEATECVFEQVRFTAAPVMEPLIEQAIKAIKVDEPCIDIVLTVSTVEDVVATMGEPSSEMPEVWIPDSPTWKGQLSAAGWTGSTIADVIAQTPVALAGGPATMTPASWSDALGGGRLAMSDPNNDGASALALLAPFTERTQTGETVEQIQQKIVPVAQAYGERAVSGDLAPTDLSTISATSTRIVPVTEATYLSARWGNDKLTLIVPETGVPMLQYPILDVRRGTIDVQGSSRDLPTRVGRAMAQWFASDAGLEAVAGINLRGPDGAALASGAGLGNSTVLANADPQITRDVLRQWRVLSVPSSILAVVDLSGSMKQSIGDVTRIQVATEAMVALDALPDHSRIGSWGFSENRGVDGQSWQEMTPLRRLDSKVGKGLTSREFLERDIAKIQSRVDGGNAIMDTVLAAYKEAQAEWDPAFLNSVVFFTDGAADDTSSISLESLLRSLKNLRDPIRPVKVIIIGISKEADTPELAQIAAAAGGQNYLVTDPNDILGVLAQALLNR